LSKDKLFRGFIWSNKAWYASANNIKNGMIHFGIYSTGGGTTGEMSMEWMEIAGDNVPFLKAFNDSWKNLASFGDILEALSRIDSKNITDVDFVKILLECGFCDLTKYTYREGE
jgi:hypothetical protein